MQLYRSGMANAVKRKNYVTLVSFGIFSEFTKRYVPVSLLYTFYLHPANIDVRREEKSPCQGIQWVCAVFPLQYHGL